jgi:DnaJ-class molecular chaperone
VWLGVCRPAMSCAGPPTFGLAALTNERFLRIAMLKRAERFSMTPKIREHTCVACNGTGFPEVEQPAQPDHKIYPVKCKACDGKGKIADAD